MRNSLVLASACVVAACASPGPDGTVRQGELLDVAMPGIDADGYVVYEVDELQNDPRAGEPFYIYLDYGEDAVRMPGPSFPMAVEQEDELYVVENATIESYVWGTELWQDGIRATINDRLRFDMRIEDFEDETFPLAVVEMTYFEGTVDTAFIMLGNGYSGVAHQIVTTVHVDGVAGAASGPYTIEVRGNPDPPPP